MQDKIAIVLTGTIVPNSVLTDHIDPETRRQEYLQAIHFYIQFAPVYFLENSSYSLNEDKEFTSIPNLFIRKMPVSLFHKQGKGYQEFEMIDSWISQEQKLPERWIKISGRYLYDNFESIYIECSEDNHHKLIIDQLFYEKSALSVLFCISTEYYLKYFKGLYTHSNDLSGDYIETVIFKTVVNIDDDMIRVFKDQPSIKVVSGSTKKYIDSTSKTLLYRLESDVRAKSIVKNKKYIFYNLPYRLSRAFINKVLMKFTAK
jgi:hypothetical protein